VLLPSSIILRQYWVARWTAGPRELAQRLGGSRPWIITGHGPRSKCHL